MMTNKIEKSKSTFCHSKLDDWLEGEAMFTPLRTIEVKDGWWRALVHVQSLAFGLQTHSGFGGKDGSCIAKRSSDEALS